MSSVDLAEIEQEHRLWKRRVLNQYSGPDIKSRFVTIVISVCQVTVKDFLTSKVHIPPIPSAEEALKSYPFADSDENRQTERKRLWVIKQKNMPAWLECVRKNLVEILVRRLRLDGRHAFVDTDQMEPHQLWGILVARLQSPARCMAALESFYSTVNSNFTNVVSWCTEVQKRMAEAQKQAELVFGKEMKVKSVLPEQMVVMYTLHQIPNQLLSINWYTVASWTMNTVKAILYEKFQEKSKAEIYSMIVPRRVVLPNRRDNSSAMARQLNPSSGVFDSEDSILAFERALETSMPGQSISMPSPSGLMTNVDSLMSTYTAPSMNVMQQNRSMPLQLRNEPSVPSTGTHQTELQDPAFVDMTNDIAGVDSGLMDSLQYGRKTTDTQRQATTSSSDVSTDAAKVTVGTSLNTGSADMNFKKSPTNLSLSTKNRSSTTSNTATNKPTAENVPAGNTSKNSTPAKADSVSNNVQKVNTPKVTAPKVNPPTVNPPTVNIPNVNTSQVNTSKVNPPNSKIPLSNAPSSLTSKKGASIPAKAHDNTNKQKVVKKKQSGVNPKNSRPDVALQETRKPAISNPGSVSAVRSKTPEIKPVKDFESLLVPKPTVAAVQKPRFVASQVHHPKATDMRTSRGNAKAASQPNSGFIALGRDNTPKSNTKKIGFANHSQNRASFTTASSASSSSVAPSSTGSTSKPPSTSSIAIPKVNTTNASEVNVDNTPLQDIPTDPRSRSRASPAKQQISSTREKRKLTELHCTLCGGHDHSYLICPHRFDSSSDSEDSVDSTLPGSPKESIGKIVPSKFPTRTVPVPSLVRTRQSPIKEKTTCRTSKRSKKNPASYAKDILSYQTKPSNKVRRDKKLY